MFFYSFPITPINFHRNHLTQHAEAILQGRTQTTLHSVCDLKILYSSSSSSLAWNRSLRFLHTTPSLSNLSFKLDFLPPPKPKDETHFDFRNLFEEDFIVTPLVDFAPSLQDTSDEEFELIATDATNLTDSTRMPFSIASSTNLPCSLQRLEFSHYNIHTLPSHINNQQLHPIFFFLTTLRIRYAKLSTIHPTAFDVLVHLVTLDLSHNKLTSLPKLHQQRSLTTLNLSYNQLVMLPALQETINLRYLNLESAFSTSNTRSSFNYSTITGVWSNESFFDMNSNSENGTSSPNNLFGESDPTRNFLSQSPLCHSRIDYEATIFSSFHNCSNLYYLSLDNMSIRELPNQLFANCSSLAVFHCKNCGLYELPASLLSLRWLIELCVEDNFLDSLISTSQSQFLSTSFLPSLEFLAIEGNPLSKVPITIRLCNRIVNTPKSGPFFHFASNDLGMATTNRNFLPQEIRAELLAWEKRFLDIMRFSATTKIDSLSGFSIESKEQSTDSSTKVQDCFSVREFFPDSFSTKLSSTKSRLLNESYDNSIYMQTISWSSALHTIIAAINEFVKESLIIDNANENHQMNPFQPIEFSLSEIDLQHAILESLHRWAIIAISSLSSLGKFSLNGWLISGIFLLNHNLNHK